MPSCSLAKGKKLLLGKKEKEVLLEESWWGEVQRGRRSVAETRQLQSSLRRRRSLLLFLHPVGIAAVPGLAGHHAASSGISSHRPQPPSLPFFGSVPPPPAFPSRVPPAEETAEPQHVDSTDFKPSETEGICPSLHSPHLSRAW